MRGFRSTQLGHMSRIGMPSQLNLSAMPHVAPRGLPRSYSPACARLLVPLGAGHARTAPFKAETGFSVCDKCYGYRRPGNGRGAAIAQKARAGQQDVNSTSSTSSSSSSRPSNSSSKTPDATAAEAPSAAKASTLEPAAAVAAPIAAAPPGPSSVSSSSSPSPNSITEPGQPTTGRGLKAYADSYRQDKVRQTTRRREAQPQTASASSHTAVPAATNTGAAAPAPVAPSDNAGPPAVPAAADGTGGTGVGLHARQLWPWGGGGSSSSSGAGGGAGTSGSSSGSGGAGWGAGVLRWGPVRSIQWAVQVALFVVLGSMMCGALAVWARGGPMRRDHPYSFVAVFDDVCGVGKGTPLRMKGVQIGQASALQTDLATAAVTVEVNEGSNIIPAGSAVEINHSGLFGDTYLDVVLPEGQPHVLRHRYGPADPGCEDEAVLVCQGAVLMGRQGANMDEMTRNVIRRNGPARPWVQ